MKKTTCLLLALLLALPAFALAAQAPDLSGLTPAQLELHRREADARQRLLMLEDAQGYADIGDGEAIARGFAGFSGQKIRLEGSILAARGEAPDFEYAVSLTGNPLRAFLLRYTLKADERLLLPGDRVTAYGVFEGLAPFTGGLDVGEGAPLVAADLIIHSLPAFDPGALGFSREHPAPLGATLTSAASRYSGYASFDITLQSASRGAQALKTARDMSKYNITPLRSQEYFMIRVQVKALTAPGGRAPIGQEDFVFVSRGGVEYRQHFLLNPPTTLGAMYEGAEMTVSLACLIDKGDTPLVVYLPQSEHPLWFDPNQ